MTSAITMSETSSMGSCCDSKSAMVEIDIQLVRQRCMEEIRLQHNVVLIGCSIGDLGTIAAFNSSLQILAGLQ